MEYDLLYRKKLRKAIEAEVKSGASYDCVASLVKNGKTRAQFLSFSKRVHGTKTMLCGRLKRLGANASELLEVCERQTFSPENFTLEGALNLGLEANATAIKCYRDLERLSEAVEEKAAFKKLVKEKALEKSKVKQEKKFDRESGLGLTKNALRRGFLGGR